MNNPGTTVARTKPALPPDVQRHIEDNRIRNAAVAAIRGTIWSKDLSAQQIGAVAQYAREVGIDPVRHIEVLGGRIYLTAEFYRERGAPLIRSGKVRVHETEYINVDPRLEALAKTGDEWAVNEQAHRQVLRIRYNAPEKAAAIAVVRITIVGTDSTYVGVNWCGGLAKRDPVGDAEPAKTAEARAERRAWRRIVSVIPELETAVGHIEARATLVEDEVAQLAGDQSAGVGPRNARLAGGENAGVDPYDLQTPPSKSLEAPVDELFPLDGGADQ